MTTARTDDPRVVGRRALLRGAVAVGAVAVGGYLAQDLVTSAAGSTSDTDWRGLPDGPVPAADARGLPYVQTVNPATLPVAVVGGSPERGLHARLPDAASASYVVQDLDRLVTEIGATVVFGPGSDAGSFCLARFDRWRAEVQEWDSVPQSSCHVAVTPHQWIYGMVRGAGLEVVAQGPLDQPSPQDGTPTTVRVTTDDRGATLTLPGGGIRRVDDARAAGTRAESFACWEFFKLGAGAAEVTFLRTWAR